MDNPNYGNQCTVAQSGDAISSTLGSLASGQAIATTELLGDNFWINNFPSLDISTMNKLNMYANMQTYHIHIVYTHSEVSLSIIVQVQRHGRWTYMYGCRTQFCVFRYTCVHAVRINVCM